MIFRPLFTGSSCTKCEKRRLVSKHASSVSLFSTCALNWTQVRGSSSSRQNF